ncbi:MAG: 2-amino-4-hydroxy-6-hydroxymethyldihydropteridine diphosphokinase [Bellilinea sp.]
MDRRQRAGAGNLDRKNMILRHIYLALGSNLGERLDNLRQALHRLPPAVQPLRVSPVYETPPWGITEQPRFLNMAAEVITWLEPLPLLDHLKQIEQRMGRTAAARYGPRLIDLDIIFYEDIIFTANQLRIPHPRLAERAFVLLPLNDLVPAKIHPVLGKSVAELLAALDLSGITPYPLPEGYELLPPGGWRSLPDDLRAALQAEPQAAAAFLRLPPSHQREYLKFIDEARKSETRRKRIETTLSMLSVRENAQ